MKRKRIWICAVIVVAAIICVGVGMYLYFKERNAGDIYGSIREKVKTEIPLDSVELPEGQQIEIPIDFAALQAINPDVYAWITVPGTVIDYPVLQHQTDNSYYLSHTIEGTPSAEGSIYTENYNSTDFEDPNTVIYGHDMLNGSMFQGLHNYQDRAFFDQNREVIIYTPDAIRRYEIFAAYVYDDRHILQSFDFTDQTVYQQYLQSIFSIRDMAACIDTDAEVNVDDKIITLSTCYGNQDDKRYLVQAVLVSIDK